MIPVAAETAVRVGADLFVCGPGGYALSDYFRIGAPLQLFLSVVTVGGFVALLGLTPRPAAAMG